MHPFTDKIDSVIVDNFATDEECDELIKISDAGNKVRATVGSAREQNTKVRNNTTSFIDVPKSLRAKVDKLLQSKGVKTDRPEQVQVQIYEPNEHYSAHTDSWIDSEVCKKGGVQQRSWTCVLYMNNVEEGGGTYFTKADARIMPAKGRLACWNNLGPDGKMNPMSEHMGEDVIKGKKYLANFWYNTDADCEEKQTAVPHIKTKSSSFLNIALVGITLVLFALVVFLNIKKAELVKSARRKIVR